MEDIQGVRNECKEWNTRNSCEQGKGCSEGYDGLQGDRRIGRIDCIVSAGLGKNWK